MRQLYDRLSLPGWQNVEPKIEAEVPALSSYKKNTYNMDEQLMQKIYARWHTVFERYGYPSRLPESAGT